MGDEALQLKNGVAQRADTGALVDPAYFANEYVGDGPPTSGTTGDTAGYRQIVRRYIDQNTGAVWFNESTNPLSPYWTPLSIQPQGPLWGAADDFRGQPSTAVTDTGTENILAQGLRVFGQGLAETDSGGVINTAGEGGNTFRLTTTDEDEHVAAIGSEAGIMQPDQHKLLVVDCEFTHVSAITLRGTFVGFIGTAADALDPPVTASAVTATLVQDDLAGVYQDVGFTDGDRWYMVHNKADEAADQDVTAGSRDTSTDLAAAGTYQRVRVEINAGGDMRVFINKTQVGLKADALDADEEVSPVFLIVSESTAVKSADLRRFGYWGCRL